MPPKSSRSSSRKNQKGVQTPMSKSARRRARARISALAGAGASVPHIKGRGAYFMPALRAGVQAMDSLIPEVNLEGRSRGASIMTGIGSKLGSLLGLSNAGANAGSWLSKLVGLGAYSVKKNSLLANIENFSTTGQPPVFSSTSEGSDIVFCHREYVGDVFATADFTVTTYPVNAGNPQLFPWMSQIASLYEEFEMLGMIFEYAPAAAMAVSSSTNIGMGRVVMATDYDCYDATFATVQQMLASEFSGYSTPYEHLVHPIECDPRRNVLATAYVVPGITNFTQANGDARLSVPCNTSIATYGQPAATVGQVMGGLWVSYHVRLSRPILEGGTGAGTIFTQHSVSTTDVSGAPVWRDISTTCPVGHPFTVETSGVSGYDGNVTLTANQAGTFIIMDVRTFTQFGTNYWTAAPLSTTLVNATLSTVESFPVTGDDGNVYAGTYNTTVTDGTGIPKSVTLFVVTFENHGSLSYSINTGAGTQTTGNLFITAYNPSVVSTTRGRGSTSSCVSSLVEEAVRCAMAKYKRPLASLCKVPDLVSSTTCSSSTSSEVGAFARPIKTECCQNSGDVLFPPRGKAPSGALATKNC